MTGESTSIEAGESNAERDTDDPDSGERTPGDAGTPDELSSEAATARILRVLGSLYLEPATGEHLERLAAWADEWLAATEATDDEIADPLRRIRAVRDADAEYLRQEFTRLFRGISRSKSPKPPYESLYRDGQLYGSAATQVQRGYRAAGVDVADASSNELPDHLGIELQFLATLCEYVTCPEDAPLEPSRARDAQEWFLDEHLLTWIEGFRGRILQADPPEFYHAVLDLTVETVRAHRVALHRRPDEGNDDAQ